MTRPRRVRRAAAVLLSTALSAVLPASAPAAPASPRSAEPSRLDALVREADDRPAAALAAIDALGSADTPADRRHRALAAAEVATRGSDPAEETRRRALAAQAAQAVGGAALAKADELYLRALRAEHDDLAAMADHARASLAAYDSACRPPSARSAATATPTGGLAPASTPTGAAPAASAAATVPTPGPAPVPPGAQAPVMAGADAAAAPDECDYRPRWRLLQLLATHARQQHSHAGSRMHARSALELASAGADPWRQAWSESDLALSAAQERDAARAQLHLDRARQFAAAIDDPRLQARLAMAEGNVASDLRDARRAEAAQQRALAIAREAGLPRLEATALVNLSDQAVRDGRPAEALNAALQGIAAARPLRIKRLERALQNNAMLARVALGKGTEARADFEALQASWGADGATGMQVTSMREFGDALASAGDLKGALELHHREAELARRLRLANRDAALAELRTRYDREAQQRGIVLLERDNALKSAELDNQGLTRRLWTLGAGVLALAMVLMLTLLRRVRETNRALEHSRARLRVQSERDALTGLANRRHFQALLQAQDAGPGFSGALMMIDIDHFKRINDDQGHASGDQVLIEVAHRIAAAVRQKDTVARWGGEEFLVLAPDLKREDTEALALRLLNAVSGSPVALADGSALRVTASIGHGVFPLPPHQVPLTPEQAVNLADMALYTAKSQGRNRAVGIVDADARDPAGLQRLEADFERAWSEGRVRLRIDRGPADFRDDGSAAASPRQLQETPP